LRSAGEAQAARRAIEQAGDRSHLRNVEPASAAEGLAEELDDDGAVAFAALGFAGIPRVREVGAEQDKVAAGVVVDVVADEPPAPAFDDVGQLVFGMKVPVEFKQRVFARVAAERTAGRGETFSKEGRIFGIGLSIRPSKMTSECQWNIRK